MTYNTLRDSQLPKTTFYGCFAVDSVSGTGFQNSTGLLFANNVTRNMVNCQSFLIHDGHNVVINGNLMVNSASGVSANTYAWPDVISGIFVTETRFRVPATGPDNSLTQVLTSTMIPDPPRRQADRGYAQYGH
jgi:hypothetical protein